MPPRRAILPRVVWAGRGKRRSGAVQTPWPGGAAALRKVVSASRHIDGAPNGLATDGRGDGPRAAGSGSSRVLVEAGACDDGEGHAGRVGDRDLDITAVRLRRLFVSRF